MARSSISLNNIAPRARMRASALDSILDWRWPTCAHTFVVHDKYQDLDVTLLFNEPTWRIPCQGRFYNFRFADDPYGSLQRSLVFLTQAELSPASLVKFTRALIRHWAIYVEIIKNGPDHVKELWDEHVLHVDTATAGKRILKLICKHELGPWRLYYLEMVTALSTRANESVHAQKAKLRRREKLLPMSTQAAIARALDEASVEIETISNDEVEGFLALALHFQHGMRPVQILTLSLEHVAEPSFDAQGRPLYVLAFHQAKLRKATSPKPPDIHRQLRPEWGPFMESLLKDAVATGRKRLFSCTSAEALWTKVRRAGRSRSLTINFKATLVRHTSIQSLADAGHGRDSIRRFASQSNLNAANSYLRATRSQARLLNEALGVSKLYSNLVSLSENDFISIEELRAAPEDEQVGGIVGERLISSLGRCKMKQKNCPFDPVLSCYGCEKFKPLSELEPHLEVFAGMREQVIPFLPQPGREPSPALLQLKRAMEGAQKAVEIARQLRERRRE